MEEGTRQGCWAGTPLLHGSTADPSPNSSGKPCCPGAPHGRTWPVDLGSQNSAPAPLWRSVFLLKNGWWAGVGGALAGMVELSPC